jgi:molybdate transport system substrate-binding protein
MKFNTWLTLLLLLHAGAVRAGEVRVAVAANFADTLRALQPVFEQGSGHRLLISSASSGKLYAQITRDAPFDVLLAADRAYPQRLIDGGRALGATRFTYARGRLVLWSAAPDVQAGPELLRAERVRHVALANPRTAPYGAAAEQALRGLGQNEAVKDKLVFGENVAQAMQFVASGNAQVGFVALAQVLNLPPDARGATWEVPRTLYAPLDQDAVLLVRGERNPAAREFLAFLRGDAARVLIQRAGYE